MLRKIIEKIPIEKRWDIEKKVLTFFDLYGRKFYSFEGEDAIVFAILNHLKITGKGFYVDVGANHPKRFSNTYYFYKNGWTGINIDPNPGTIKLFNKYRKRDINLEVPISNEDGHLDFYVFNESNISSFDKELSEERMRINPKYKIIDVLKIKTRKLRDVLQENIPAGQHIDFMSVDTEGHDLNVLKSNDWEKFRPAILLVEENNSYLEEIFRGNIYKFLVENDYGLFSKTFNTLIFVDKRVKS